MRVVRSRTLANSFRLAWLVVALLAVSMPVRAERLPIKTYTTADGLTHNRVSKVVRDSRGFLWFCTGDGLSRFDGYTFTNYGTDQGLPNRAVTDFLETSKGEYWIATGAGLVRFNPNAAPEHRVIYANDTDARTRPMFSVIANDEDGPTRSVTVLLENHDGAIWCGTDKGLYRLEEDKEHFWLRPVNIGIPPDWTEGGIISDLLEGADGSLWVATPNGLYRRWPDGGFAHYTKGDGLPDNYLHDLLEDHQGQLWAGTRYGGFFRFVADDTHKPPIVAEHYSMQEGMPVPWVFQLFEASDHKFWIATAHGLVQFLPNGDERGRLFHTYSEKNGLSYFDITALNQDLAGNLWLGTLNAGAMKLERNGFVTYDQRDGICEIDSIFEDRTGAVCFRGSVFGDQRTSFFEGARPEPLGGSLDHHYLRLGRFEEQRFSWFKPGGIPDLGWRSEGVTLQAPNGEWWIGTTAGLYRFRAADTLDQIKAERPLAVYASKDGIEDNQLLRLFADSRSNIWIARWFTPKPLWLWERATETLRDLSSAPGFRIENDIPHSFCEDRAGNVWIGFSDRIARYRDGGFTFFTATDGVPPGAITSIYLDHAGRLWLASARSGLIRVDDPQAERPEFISYSTAQGLSSNSTELASDRLIIEDLQGRIYIGTARGLDRLDAATGHFWHFTTADGLASGSFRSCFRDRHGGLWFGTTGGLSHFVPAPDDQPQAAPTILISALRVAGSNRFVSAVGETDVTLPDLAADQNQLQIDFIGPSFAAGGVLHYQHQLEGNDADWSTPTEQRSVDYRLAPGRYRFLVRAVNSDGVASSSPAVVTFRILPPIWARWWFVGLVGGVLTLMLFWLYRYRVARLLELERVRTRIASDLHDDIGANLTKIAILSEVAYQQLGNVDKDKDSPLASIARISRESVASMSDIVWAVKPGRDRLRDLTRRMRGFAADTLTARNIRFQFRAPDVNQQLNLRADVRRDVFLIFKEAINNVVRHSACAEASIELRILGDHLELKIDDNGKGFELAEAGDGQGLINMHKRAEGFGGRFEVASLPGSGTSVTLQVPLGRKRWFSSGLNGGRFSLGRNS